MIAATSARPPTAPRQLLPAHLRRTSVGRRQGRNSLPGLALSQLLSAIHNQIRARAVAPRTLTHFRPRFSYIFAVCRLFIFFFAFFFCAAHLGSWFRRLSAALQGLELVLI